MFNMDSIDSFLFRVRNRYLCFYHATMVSDFISTYANLGGVVGQILSASMKFTENWTIHAGESIGDESNWIDITKCGRPWLEFQVATRNIGALNLRAIVDYGRPVGNQMMQIRQQTFNMAQAVTYSPETPTFVMDLSRTYGGYIRLRTIDNTGAIDVDVTTVGPGSFKSYEGA